ncbi:MAG: DUF512 domain-containing protein [Firmicutes bacterium]|uniref:DUF512 domain-containing protein n=1 Tax=Candidatus Scybalomonas excrementavium TaxID=2840943 RepID=A0A9D9I161_9FIRM|nr:DUF512 domain-containing protein [Candidatus Scybalomonas excrementavium]
MKKKYEHVVTAVEEGSIADELGITIGDVLLTINGQEIGDIFDYQYLIEDEIIDMVIRHIDGSTEQYEFEKDEDMDLGITFGESLMDEYRSCHNKCIFCFIDQMPEGMRETLYFKDDDTRLSFLQGNYVTLTNLKDEDLDRIIRYKLAPINISVQATDPELRKKMLNNRFAGDILQKIKKLADAEIPMNAQVVLCKGYNDKENLDRTISDLSQFIPYMQSLSIVPIGLTKYRQGLTQIEPFTKEEAGEVLDQVHRWQKILKEKYQNRFVHASDEWFLLAERELPDEEYYEGYGQIENGVGMLRSFISEFDNALKDVKGDDRVREVSIATAKLAYPTICYFAEELEKKFSNLKVHVYCIINHFFGEMITVTGLMTAGDMIEQLKEQALGNTLLLPENVLKADEPIFLDDITLEEFQKTLQVPVNIVQSNGQDFIEKVIGDEI